MTEQTPSVFTAATRHEPAPIGVFDSGFGGLSVLRSLQRRLPQYSYLYLGDNARAPYGTRSFDTVHRFTQQAVSYLMDQCGCPLVILACNTASAKALRTIQQRWLPVSADPTRRVLGVIRPTAEAVGSISRDGHIGVFATPGTIASGSYDIEIHNLNPAFKVTGHACPMWVPLVEYGYADTAGADWFVHRDVETLLQRDPQIDTVLLACTHYPLLYDKIRAVLPDRIALVAQGDLIADSLALYLQRHPEMEARLHPNATERQPRPSTVYLTTDHSERFAQTAALFLGHPITAATVTLP